MRARNIGPMVEVDVEDEGIGIAPGDHERIFERFVQGETGDRRRFGGVGIGLYIVRRLAVAQHGAIIARPAQRRHDHAPDPPGDGLTRERAGGRGEWGRPRVRVAVAGFAAGRDQVLVDHAGDVVAVAQDLAGFHPDDPGTALLDLAEVVGDKEDRPRFVRSSLIRLWDLVRNEASPVASASSIIRISWLLAEAIANRRRCAMPVE